MPWHQLTLGILGEFAERQRAHTVEVEAALRSRLAWIDAQRREANRAAVAKWNAAHPKERRERQRVYDARKNAKRKTVGIRAVSAGGI